MSQCRASWGRPVTIIGGGLLGLMLMATAAVAQESVAVRANLVKGSLPADDPAAAAWNQAPPSEFPMSPQVHWKERIQAVTVNSVKVRSLHDGTTIAIMLEYEDPTQDPDDAAALEFMVGDTSVAGERVDSDRWSLDVSALGVGPTPVRAVATTADGRSLKSDLVLVSNLA